MASYHIYRHGSNSSIMNSILLSSLLVFGFGGRSLPTQSGEKIFSKKGNVELVPIPAGEFTMGGSRDNERPQRKVYLGDYLIGKTPVTVGQFKAYCAATGFNMGQLRKPFWGW